MPAAGTALPFSTLPTQARSSSRTTSSCTGALGVHTCGPLLGANTQLGEIVTTPATRLARDQEAERLRVALTRLSVDQQLLVELRYWHDLDATALGEVFDVPPATIRTRLRRARLAPKARSVAPRTNSITM